VRVETGVFDELEDCGEKGEEGGRGGRGEEVLDGLEWKESKKGRDELELSPREMHWYCAPMIASVPLLPRSCFR
jgi:hypothetical protein